MDEVTGFDTDQSLVAAPKAPIINRKVVRPAKKRTVTMKKTRSPKAAAKPKKNIARQALSDRTNLPDNVVEDAEEETAVVKKRRAPKTKAEDSTSEAKPRIAKKASTRKREQSPEYMRVIPETQVPQDVSQSIEADDDSMQVDEPVVEPVPASKAAHGRSASAQRQPQPYAARARSASVQPRTYSREGSAALAERRVADSEMRRKLVDMTEKYEDMRLRYESLSELGTQAANINFDKLKRATDQRAKDASELIASLKKELAEARKSSSSNTADNAKLQTQLSALQSNEEKSHAELKDVRRSLAETQNEVKSLTAKLEAARKAANSAAADAARAPGSAIKARSATSKNDMSGNLDSTKQAALKEDLYRDLTGLIISSVRRRDGEDEFSCIQTGKNGTLQFHLTINNDSNQPNPKTPSGMSFEETEFAYEPFFDEGRDRDLIDILPDYLTEEICFPRAQAVKFYTKVVDSMNKKVEMMED